MPGKPGQHAARRKCQPASQRPAPAALPIAVMITPTAAPTVQYVMDGEQLAAVITVTRLSPACATVAREALHVVIEPQPGFSLTGTDVRAFLERQPATTEK